MIEKNDLAGRSSDTRMYLAEKSAPSQERGNKVCLPGLWQP